MDEHCPRCGAEVRSLPTTGDYEDYECPSCGLAFRITGSDRQAFKNGAPVTLVTDANGRVLLTANPAQWRCLRA